MAIAPKTQDANWLTAVKNGVGALLSLNAKPLATPTRAATVRAKSRTPPKVLIPVDNLLIRQQIWGEGCLFPGEKELGIELVKPFAVDSSMSLCDLTAGLGGPSRKVATEFDVYITGYEQVAEIAARGHALSLAQKLEKQLPISPMALGLLKLKPRSFNGVYGHLLTWTVPDKQKLFVEIKQGLKADGGFNFTDFVLADGQTADPLVARILKKEPSGTPPWRKQDIITSLKAAGFNCRVSQDLSDQLATQVIETWKAYLKGAKLKTRPRNELVAILEEAEIWCLRLSAMRNGMLRYFRFYSTVAK